MFMYLVVFGSTILWPLPPQLCSYTAARKSQSLTLQARLQGAGLRILGMYVIWSPSSLCLSVPSCFVLLQSTPSSDLHVILSAERPRRPRQKPSVRPKARHLGYRRCSYLAVGVGTYSILFV
ncbi:hypothetical protein HDV63DRAFT_52936 [Trichoderma sp. SZMC 28014]